MRDKYWLFLPLFFLLIPLILVLATDRPAQAQTEEMIVQGQVQLQGRSDSSGVTISSGEYEMQARPDGWFEMALHGNEYSLTFHAPAYLSISITGNPEFGLSRINLGSLMMLGGDMTADDQIDVFDLAYMGARYGQPDALADLNGDGQVEIFDITIAASNFQQKGKVIEPDIDKRLRTLVNRAGLTPLNPGPVPDPAKVALGQMVFFDKEMSGNRDISCATCHHPFLHSSDGLAISIGTGSRGLGPERMLESGRRLHPRNSPDLFNRGVRDWRVFFWDGRVNGEPGNFNTPAGAALPPDLDNIVAALAMFPATARDEMRGMPNDLDEYGVHNEMADFEDEDFLGIWEAITKRLLAIDDYKPLFHAAYPHVPEEQLGFQHVANANAAFIINSFTLLDSPWDRYLRGEQHALSEEAKQGALLFYGKANCVACHSGNLLTDQLFHNLAVPQLGPGQVDEEPLDSGRSRETDNAADRFAFRTPPLRNVTLTGPWMHNGAFNSLEAVIRHKLNPEQSLRSYDVQAHINPAFQDTLQDDEETITALLATLDPVLADIPPLTEQEIKYLLTFLEALTDPNAVDMRHLIPASVPSGLPIED